ncbi:unnamed protein product, partial [Didymodactylos carnosus]
HGLSQGEIDKRYDGWNDPDLSQLGTNQARRAGAALHQAGFPVDLCYTSVLKRASKSLFLILDEMDLLWLQVHTTWRLNDRMIGALTGFQQDRADSLFGQSQLKEWLTRAQNAPPALEESNPNHPRSDPKYRNISNVVPSTETLVDVQKRILPLWYDEISQNLNMGKNILVVAHEETLKAIIRFINNYMTDEFSQNELPVCIPIIFEFSSETQEIVNGYYLISSLLDQVNSYQSKLFPTLLFVRGADVGSGSQCNDHRFYMDSFV